MGLLLWATTRDHWWVFTQWWGHFVDHGSYRTILPHNFFVRWATYLPSSLREYIFGRPYKKLSAVVKVIYWVWHVTHVTRVGSEDSHVVMSSNADDSSPNIKSHRVTNPNKSIFDTNGNDYLVCRLPFGIWLYLIRHLPTEFSLSDSFLSGT